MSSDNNPKPYERQSEESVQAYEAFLAYCEFDNERSTAKVGQKLGKSKTLCDRWSSQWNWVERAKAYDAELAKARMEANKQAYLVKVAEHSKRRLEAAEKLYKTAVKLLEVVEKRLENVDLVEQSLRKAPVTKTGDDESLSITELKAIAWTYDLKTIAFAYGMATKGMQASFDDEAEGLAIDKLFNETELAANKDEEKLQAQSR